MFPSLISRIINLYFFIKLMEYYVLHDVTWLQIIMFIAHKATITFLTVNVRIFQRRLSVHLFDVSTLNLLSRQCYHTYMESSGIQL